MKDQCLFSSTEGCMGQTCDKHWVKLPVKLLSLRADLSVP